MSRKSTKEESTRRFYELRLQRAADSMGTGVVGVLGVYPSFVTFAALMVDFYRPSAPPP
jgi:hypothetical protein